jgi:hypothetical protein
VRISPEERAQYLDSLAARLKTISAEPPQVLPPVIDFPGWGKEGKRRFMVTVTRTKPVDEKFQSLIPQEFACLAELKRTGVLLASHLSPPQAEPWRGFLYFRESDVAAVQQHLDALPLAAWLGFETVEVS